MRSFRTIQEAAGWLRAGEFFLFLTFFNNILSLTHIGFYLQGVTRLVAPSRMVRQIVSVAPVHVA